MEAVHRRLCSRNGSLCEQSPLAITIWMLMLLLAYVRLRVFVCAVTRQIWEMNVIGQQENKVK